MPHPGMAFSLLLAAAFVLRFGPVFEHLVRLHLGPTFWVVTVGILILNVATARQIWSDRASYHLVLPTLNDALVYGVGLGLVILGLNAGAVSLAHGTKPVLPNMSTLPVFLFHAIAQFLIAANVEEPIFRGFLWGHLRRRGQLDWSVFLIQAFLFFVAHLYYAEPGKYIYWFNTLIMGLGFGFAAWRTRSILPAMIAHAIANCGSLLFAK